MICIWIRIFYILFKDAGNGSDHTGHGCWKWIALAWKAELRACSPLTRLWKFLYDAKILSYFRVMKCVLFMQYIKCSIHPDALTADTDLATPSIRIRIYVLMYTYIIIHTHDVWVSRRENMRFSIDHLWAHYDALLKMIQYHHYCTYLSYKQFEPNEGNQCCFCVYRGWYFV